MHEIAPLQPVLENHRRPTVQKPCSEDGEDASIGIRKRLMWSVHIEETHCDHFAVVSGADNQWHSLLRIFVQRINGMKGRRLRLRRGYRFQGISGRHTEFPAPRLELLQRPWRRLNQPVSRPRKTFSI